MEEAPLFPLSPGVTVVTTQCTSPQGQAGRGGGQGTKAKHGDKKGGEGKCPRTAWVHRSRASVLGSLSQVLGVPRERPRPLSLLSCSFTDQHVLLSSAESSENVDKKIPSPSTLCSLRLHLIQPQGNLEDAHPHFSGRNLQQEVHTVCRCWGLGPRWMETVGDVMWWMGMPPSRPRRRWAEQRHSSLAQACCFPRG